MGKRLVLVALLVLAASELLACGSRDLFVRTRVRDAPWQTFAEAKEAFDRIELGVTTTAELKVLSLDPASSSASTTVTYVDVEEKFAPHEGLPVEAAAEGVRRCVQMRQGCDVWKIDTGRRTRRRMGNVVLDWLLIRRVTHTESWRFEALILLEEDRVIYKIWSGEPRNLRQKDRLRPLGFLQDIFDSLKAGGAIFKIVTEVQ